MTNSNEFKKWVRWLRKHFPSVLPTRVELCPPSRIPNHDGLCTCTFDINDINKPVRLLCQVTNNLNDTLTRETLWEEWAHVLRWHLPGFGSPREHDELYGVIFNMIKRHHLGEIGSPHED